MDGTLAGSESIVKETKYRFGEILANGPGQKKSKTGTKGLITHGFFIKKTDKGSMKLKEKGVSNSKVWENF